MTNRISDEDKVLLEADLESLRASGDEIGSWYVSRILNRLAAASDSGAQTRSVATSMAAPKTLETRTLVAFDASAALGDRWERLDDWTRDLLSRAVSIRLTLGEDPEFGRAIGIYVGVAFENEVRARTQDPYVTHIMRVEKRLIHSSQVTLRMLCHFLKSRGFRSPHMFNVLEARNKVAHPEGPFLASDFNAMIHQAGFLGSPGAFQHLSGLALA